MSFRTTLSNASSGNTSDPVHPVIATSIVETDGRVTTVDYRMNSIGVKSTSGLTVEP